MREYIIRDNQSNKIYSTLSDFSNSLFSKCVSISEKLKIDKKEYRQGKKIFNGIEVYIITDDHNLVASSNLFKTVLDVYLDCALEIDKAKNNFLITILHELTSINARMIQEAYIFLPPESLIGDYSKQFSIIKEAILLRSDDATDMFNRICKNNYALKSKLLSLRALHDLSIELRKKKLSIRQVVLRVCHGHFSELKDIDVIMNINEDPFDFHLELDFDTFTSALDPFLDNVVKYVLPGSKIDVSFVKENNLFKTIFNMVSLKIEEEEREKIFHYGYSGIAATKDGTSGQGIGLYASNKLLLLNSAKLKLTINRSKSEKYLNNVYQNNIFEIVFSF